MNAQSQPPKSGAQRKDPNTPSKNAGPSPRADFGVASTESAGDPIRRKSRENRRRNFFPLVPDPGKLVSGKQETNAVMIEDIVIVENPDPFYPATPSSAVIVGSVVSAKGFVSDDRT